MFYWSYHFITTGQLGPGVGVSAGTLSRDGAATPQEGSTPFTWTHNVAAAEAADGLTTTGSELHKSGFGKVADMADQGGGVWTVASGDVLLALEGTYFAVRVCAEGNRNSNSVALDVDEVTATLNPSTTTPTEGADVTFTAAVNYGEITEARFYDTADQLAETVSAAPWQHVHADIAPGSHVGWRVELDVTEAGARVVGATSATVTAAAEAPTLDAPTDEQEVPEGTEDLTLEASGTVDGFDANTVSMRWEISAEGAGSWSTLATDSGGAPWASTGDVSGLAVGQRRDVRVVRVYSRAQGGSAEIASPASQIEIVTSGPSIVDIGVTPVFYWDADAVSGLSDGADFTNATFKTGALAGSAFNWDSGVGNFPSYQATAFGGKPCVRFDSANTEQLRSTAAALLALANGTDTPMTAVIQLQHVTIAANQSHISWDAGTVINIRNLLILSSGPQWRLQTRGGATTAAHNVAAVGSVAVERIIGHLWGNETTQLADFYQDATKTGSALNVDTETVTATHFRIGARNTGSTDFWLNARIRRIALYASKITPTQFETLRSAWAGA